MADYKLRSYQERAVRAILKNKATLLTFEMGAGKTLTALDAFVRSNANNFVAIVPAYLKTNWENEILKFFSAEVLDKGEIVSYEGFKKNKTPCDFLVLDEAHYIKQPKSQRARAVLDYVNTIRPKYVVMLTGTPMTKSAGDLFPYFKIISNYSQNTPEYDTYWQFCKKFCNMKPNRFSTTGYSFEGVKNVTLLKSYIDDCFVRIRKDEKEQLPETVDHHIFTKKTLDDNVSLMLKALEEEANHKALMSLKRINAENNILSTIKLIKYLQEQEAPTLIFSDHIKSAKKISEMLDIPVIYGGLRTKQRNEILERVKKGEVKYLVGTYGAMSEGLNLVEFKNMVFNDYPFVYKQYAQARARIHRIGQEHVCNYFHIYVNDMDKNIFDLIGRDSQTISKVINS